MLTRPKFERWYIRIPPLRGSTRLWRLAKPPVREPLLGRQTKCRRERDDKADALSEQRLSTTVRAEY